MGWYRCGWGRSFIYCYYLLLYNTEDLAVGIFFTKSQMFWGQGIYFTHLYIPLVPHVVHKHSKSLLSICWIEQFLKENYMLVFLFLKCFYYFISWDRSNRASKVWSRFLYQDMFFFFREMTGNNTFFMLAIKISFDGSSPYSS